MEEVSGKLEHLANISRRILSQMVTIQSYKIKKINQFTEIVVTQVKLSVFSFFG